jgi:hypothetical protein
MNYPLQPLFDKLDQDLSSDQERLRIMAIGSSDWIIESIHQLHSLGFAEVGDWSPLLPMPNSDDAMSILTKTRSRR